MSPNEPANNGLIIPEQDKAANLLIGLRGFSGVRSWTKVQ
jgi:hypothetical protein